MGWKTIAGTGRVVAILLTLSSRADAAPAEAVAEPARSKRVLALYDFAKESPANVLWDAKVRETLEKAGAEPVEYYAEFLDAARFSDPNHMAVMHDYLAGKYANRPVDAIIALDLGTRLLVGPGRDIFAGVPIVHTVGLGPHPAANSDDPRLVGLRGVFDAARTVELALRLHPSTTEVAIVCSTARRDGFLEGEVRRQLTAFEGRTKLTYLLNLPHAETLARIRELGRRALVLFVVAYDPQDQTRPGRFPSQVATEIARVSGLPVYGLFSSYLQEGVVGGYVYSLEDAAAIAARAVRQILNGTKPRDIPRLDAPIVPMFDWRELRRWGIDEASLPAGSQVLFRQVTAWESYRRYFIAGASVLVLALALIGGLLVERRGRRQALRAVERSHAELVQRIAEREQAERALRENHERLAEAQDADRRKDEFLATLAHELRNPLAPIRNALQILQDAEGRCGDASSGPGT